MIASVRVGAGGALGGAVNAGLCYMRLPVAVGDFPHPHFAWHVIPAGALHGALLAMAAFSVGVALSNHGLRARLTVAVPLAWLAGFISWIPLNRSAFDEPWAKSFTWPFHEGWGAMLNPFWIFGLVALLYYMAVALRLARERRLVVHVALTSLAGILGSLWWWITFGPWYFSILHGAIWGTFVGIGAWTTRGSRRMVESFG
jgi:hypothetical protein